MGSGLSLSPSLLSALSALELTARSADQGERRPECSGKRLSPPSFFEAVDAPAGEPALVEPIPAAVRNKPHPSAAMSIVRGYGPDACDDLTYKTSNHEFFGTPGDEIYIHL